jgi:hypothetical protein
MREDGNLPANEHGRDEKEVNLWNPLQRASLTAVNRAPQAETSIST